MEIRLYFEGDAALKPGFDRFLAELKERARAGGVRFRLVAAGGDPVSDYRKGMRANPNAVNLLLRDSEGPLGNCQLDHCREHGIHPQNVFWMVELMESRFLGDPAVFERVYGRGTNTRALGATEDVESIPKREVVSRIGRAVQDTRRGRYHKTRDGPELLGYLNAAAVRRRAPKCNEMFDSLQARIGY